MNAAVLTEDERSDRWASSDSLYTGGNVLGLLGGGCCVPHGVDGWRRRSRSPYRSGSAQLEGGLAIDGLHRDR
jgi:hypothetical protein